MFEINVFNTTLFSLLFLGIFYVGACMYRGSIIKLQYKKLFYYITIFSLLGIVGEVFVNTIYAYLFNTPLWEYRLFPAHNGSISYFFIFVWGSLGVYKYITNYIFTSKKANSEIYGGLVMGAEAIILELLYNGSYFLFFNNYIFYYFPANLGPLSHFSCLQVIPFYFIVGLLIHILAQQPMPTGYIKSAFVFGFYWMIIITFVWLV